VLVLFDAEVLRLLVSVASLVLLMCQWSIYRKSCVGLHLTFITTLLVTFCIPCFWLALNVVRFYTYDGDNPDSTRGWIHSNVIRTQGTIAWVGVALVVLVCALGVLDFARIVKTRKALE
jgi:hypothetical protein